MENKAEEAPRTYTMSFEDGKTVTKTAEELTPEQIYACEKTGEFNAQIGRLNATLADNIVLRDHYQTMALPGFKEDEPEEEEKGEEAEA